MTKLLICGGQGFKDTNLMMSQIISCNPTEITCGEGSGACKVAKIVAKKLSTKKSLAPGYTWSVPFHVFPLEVKKYEKAAQAMQNQKMLDVGKPDMILVFPGGDVEDIVNRAPFIKLKYGG